MVSAHAKIIGPKAKRVAGQWIARECVRECVCFYGRREKNRVSEKTDRKRCVLKGDTRDMNLDTPSLHSPAREKAI